VVTIDVLPDDVLLAIFDFFVVKYQDLHLLELAWAGFDTKGKIESWQSLVHVCRRWRGLVFGSPRRLNLQLHVLYPGTLARKSLDVWPALPLLISGSLSEVPLDNLIAELEHSADRIRKIYLSFYSVPQIEIEKLWMAMQVPFPELEFLLLRQPTRLFLPALPDTFLGGSAQRLRFLRLESFPSSGKRGNFLRLV
jgi:hypothetical protein